MALSASAFAALIGCRASAPLNTVPDRVPPSAAAPRADAPGDAAYDWHGLLVAPFGAVLKAVPMTLHEVLLFRDEANGSSSGPAATAPECYASDVPAPNIFGRTPDEYVLCFTHDRLSRVQASVRLSAAGASTEFAAACAVWLKNAAAAASTAEAPVAEAPGRGSPADESAGNAHPNTAACEGFDGSVHFKGSLGEEREPEDMADTESVVSITLDSAPGP